MFSVLVLCTETQDGVETQGMQQVREQSCTPLTQDNAEQKNTKNNNKNSDDYVTAKSYVMVNCLNTQEDRQNSDVIYVKL